VNDRSPAHPAARATRSTRSTRSTRASRASRQALASARVERGTRARVRVRVRAGTRARTSGFSLIIAMLMLAVIGLASAAIMRNATSGDQVANNNRLQTQANQYAQLAMRYCESQLGLPGVARSVLLFPLASPPSWTQQRNWTTPGPRLAHTLVARDIGSAVQPRIAPQCMMESAGVPNVYTVTARGFSADFRADPRTGSTLSGSSIWLQATVYAEGDGGAAGADPSTDSPSGDGPLSIRQRLWQQLLTPPF
jgi:type IV pilus assembly protein PilX